MPQQKTVELLDGVRQNLADLVTRNARALPGLQHYGFWVHVKSEKGAMAENGHEKASSEEATIGFSVRVISGHATVGYHGGVLGVPDLGNIEGVVWQGIRQAHQRAEASARIKVATKARFADLGQIIAPTELAPGLVVQSTVPVSYTQDARLVSLDETVGTAVDGCIAVQGQSNSIGYAAT